MERTGPEPPLEGGETAYKGQPAEEPSLALVAKLTNARIPVSCRTRAGCRETTVVWRITNPSAVAVTTLFHGRLAGPA
jgi:hypothetical protein